MKHLIGLDIGGTKCAVILGQLIDNENIIVVDKLLYPTTEYPSPDKMLCQLKEGIEKLLSDHNLSVKDIASIGISCGGPLDSRKGIILSPPNLPGWDNVSIVKFFEDRFSIPTSLQNDANACALVEWIMGAGKGTSNMIFLTFGTGMGAGLILDGRLYSGTNDLGGEVGHIRLAKEGPVGFGKAGSFEGFCSGGGIAQLAKSMMADRLNNNQQNEPVSPLYNVKNIDARMVALTAQEGDPLAKEIIRTSAHYLGMGLAVLIDILNPECIVIGSIYARNELLFKTVVDQVLKSEAIPLALDVCKIKPAALGDTIGDYAALCVAVYKDKF